MKLKCMKKKFFKLFSLISIGQTEFIYSPTAQPFTNLKFKTTFEKTIIYIFNLKHLHFLAFFTLTYE